jgi:hypothetical protein
MPKQPRPDLSHIEPDLWSLARPIVEFVLDPHQAREHDERSIAEIKDSLRLGQKKPIVVRRDGMIVEAGNGTVMAARELGWTHLAAVVSDDPEAALREYAIRDNRSAEFARWRPEVVANELQLLDLDPFTVGWNEFEFSELMDTGSAPDEPEANDGGDPVDLTTGSDVVRFMFGIHSGNVSRVVYNAFTAWFEARRSEGCPSLETALSGVFNG